ncbi:MAG: HEPN/Toprim-associated domain-containing protein [Burkholderiaceae bacterium]|nr:HEPN/Toprim-associated domain-containing protein [Burkholderiaceae bacterium]
MGTYTDFTVAGFTVVSSKSAVVPELMTVFRESDRKQYRRHLESGATLAGEELDAAHTDDIEDVVEYSCQVAKAIDRLNIMGFTLGRAKRDFDIGRSYEIEKYESWMEDDPSHETWTDELQFLRSLSFDQYLEALRTVVIEKIYSYSVDGKKRDFISPVQKYIVEGSDEYLFGFFAEDVRCLVRAVCEVAARDQLVSQDVSELVSGGYYGPDTEVCNEAIQALVAGHPENSKQIILTEGSTDASILRRALNLLYPHLSDYYSFLDFESTRSPGGAGHLVSLIKAFSATGITNKVIALFDNDTAAADARRSLAAVSLPRNISIRAYPNLAVLRNYPTLGPSGNTELDVNGLAASIELYLGRDVLTQDEGGLTPVQWKGYNETLGQYQGEVMRKAQLHHAFDRKADAALANSALLAAGDWSGLSAIAQAIFTAFDDEA